MKATDENPLQGHVMSTQDLQKFMADRLKSLSPSEIEAEMRWVKDICEKIDGHEFWFNFKNKYYQNV